MNRTVVLFFVLSTFGTGWAEAAPTTIGVSGTGTVAVMPDEAVVSASVVTNAPDAAAAVSENSAQYQRVVDAVTRSGIARDDVTLSYYSVDYTPKSPDAAANSEPERTGYTVTRAFSIKVREMSRAGRIVDAATTAGATTISGVSFDRADTTAAKREATAKAVADARAKAQGVAAAAGLRITGIASVALDGEGPPVVPMMRMSAMAAPRAPTQFDAGTVNVTSSVSVQFDAVPGHP